MKREAQVIIIDRLRVIIKGLLVFFLPSFIRKGFYQYEPRPLKEENYKVKLISIPPRISVIIPSLNQAKYLERCILSVLNQGYPNLELIVVDGGSTDGSVEIIKKYESNLHWWCSEHDSGQAEAINKGFKRSEGEILAWLNADDCYMKNTLARVCNSMGGNSDIDVVYGYRYLIDIYDQEIGMWILPLHRDNVLNWVDYIPQETLFWRRTIWDDIGGKVDVSFDFAIDWDLLLRFRSSKAKMVRLPYFMGSFRIHDKQKTSSIIDSVGFKEIQRLRYRTLGYVPSKTRCRIGVIWYLIKARFYEIFHNKSLK